MIVVPLAYRRNPRAEAVPFLKVWGPSFLVFLGTTLSTFGLNWWLAHSPGGSSLLGLTAGAAHLIAIVGVVACAGVIDRRPAFGVLVRLKLTLVVVMLGLLVTYAGGSRRPLWVLAATVSYIIIESTQALYFAGLETTLAELAPSGWPSSRTASLVQLQRHVARLVATLVGGSLLVADVLWGVPLAGALAVILTTVFWLAWRDVLPTYRPPSSARQDSSMGPAWSPVGLALSDAREAATWMRSRPLLIFMLVIPSRPTSWSFRCTPCCPRS